MKRHRFAGIVIELESAFSLGVTGAFLIKTAGVLAVVSPISR
jgi:hypothetical protein